MHSISVLLKRFNSLRIQIEADTGTRLVNIRHAELAAKALNSPRAWSLNLIVSTNHEDLNATTH